MVTIANDRVPADVILDEHEIEWLTKCWFDATGRELKNSFGRHAPPQKFVFNNFIDAFPPRGPVGCRQPADADGPACSGNVRGQSFDIRLLVGDEIHS